MSSTTTTTARPPAGSGSRLRIGLYLVLAVAGLIGTWSFNLSFASAATGQGYVQAWFANPASSSAAVDVIVTALAACVFYLVEGRRIGLRLAWVLVPLTFLLALAFTFPLFLALRERRLAATPPAP